MALTRFVACLLATLQLHVVIVLHPYLTARQQAASGLILGEVDKALIDGGDEELRLLEVALKIHQTMKKD